MPKPSIRPAAGGDADACPGALRLHDAADGPLARVRVPGGRMTGAQLTAVRELAEGYGDGHAELTSRANLQLRALKSAPVGQLQARLEAAGLLPSPTHELVRNIAASPLAGGPLDVASLVAALDRALCADPGLAALPGRFLFAVDGGRGDVAFGADVAALPLGAEVAISFGGTDAGLRVRPDEVIPALLAAAHAFLAERAAQHRSPAGPGDHPQPRPTDPDAFASGSLPPAISDIYPHRSSSDAGSSMGAAPDTYPLPTTGGPGTPPDSTPDAAPHTAPSHTPPPASGLGVTPDIAPRRTPPPTGTAPDHTPPPGSAPSLGLGPSAAPDIHPLLVAGEPGTPPRGNLGAVPSAHPLPTSSEPGTYPPPPIGDSGAVESGPTRWADSGVMAGAGGRRRVAWRVRELVDGPARVAARTATALGVTLGEPGPLPRPGVREPLGILGQPDGLVAVGVLVPLGRLSGAQLKVLESAATLVFTPWRGVVLPDLAPAAAETWLADLAGVGLEVAAGSRWVGVTTCAGQPGCAKSLADVRHDAFVATTAGEGLPVHWVGCARGCGSPAGPHVRVEATGSGYEVRSPHLCGFAPPPGTAARQPAGQRTASQSVTRGLTADPATTHETAAQMSAGEAVAYDVASAQPVAGEAAAPDVRAGQTTAHDVATLVGAARKGC